MKPTLMRASKKPSSLTRLPRLRTDIAFARRQYARWGLMWATLLAIGGISAITGQAFAAKPPSSLGLASSGAVGFWRTQDGDGVIELYRCDNDLCGRFHWIKENDPAHPSQDDKNHEPNKRQRPLCGLTFMGGFSPNESDRYTGGWIYSPHDGNTYSATLTLHGPDTLEVHGYAFLPILGESQEWQRVLDPPSCQPSPLHGPKNA